MKKIYLTLCAAALILGGTSCTNYLNSDQPIGLIVKGEDPSYGAIVASTKSAYEPLSSRLNIFGSWSWDDGTVTRQEFVLQDIASDDAQKKWTPDGDQVWMDQVDNFSFTSNNGAFNGIWIYDYEGLGRANTSISFLTNDDLIKKVGMTDAVKNQLLGESYFLRAYYYFDLVNNFGDVPLISAPITTVEAAYAAAVRAPKADVMTMVNSDLATAKTLLPQTKYSSASEPWRVSYGAVLALQAKIALFNKDWATVVTDVDAITAVGFSLNSNYFDCFDMNKEFAENEDIFVYNHETKVTPANGNGLCALLGWGFLAPTTDFINEFEANDPRLLYTVNVPDKHINKVLGTLDGTNNGFDDAATNKIYIRYADALLWKAEAELELSHYSAAVDIINQVRSRARNTPTADGSVVPAGTLPARDNTSTDKVLIKNWLMHERRVELGFESQRFNDLKRWGIAKQVLTAQGKGFQDKNYLYPIPQNIIDNTGTITQNPGY